MRKKREKAAHFRGNVRREVQENHWGAGPDAGAEGIGGAIGAGGGRSGTAILTGFPSYRLKGVLFQSKRVGNEVSREAVRVELHESRQKIREVHLDIPTFHPNSRNVDPEFHPCYFDKGNVYFDNAKVYLDDGEFYFDRGKIYLDDGKIYFDGGKIYFDRGKIYFDGGKIYFDGGKFYFDGGNVYLNRAKVYFDEGNVYLDDSNFCLNSRDVLLNFPD